MMTSRSDREVSPAPPGGSSPFGRRPALAAGLAGVLLLTLSHGSAAGTPEGRPLPPETAARGLIALQETARDSARTVRVEVGDTLWSLAERHLGAAVRWRLLQRANADRLADPHRLRPGMELVIPGPIDGGRAAAVAVDTAPGPDPRRSLFFRRDEGWLGELTVDRTRGLSRVAPAEFARAPFLHRLEETRSPMRTLGRAGRDAGGRQLPVSLRRRDRVRIAVGSWTVDAGDRLQAIRWEGRLRDHGRVARPVAVLRVLERRGDTAVAEVSRLYGFYRVGAPVLPLPEVPELRGGEPVPAEASIAARLVGHAADRPLVMPGASLFLDVGAAAGVRPGDEFVVPSSRRGAGGRPGVAARLRVIRAEEQSSTVRVLEIRYPELRPGTDVRLHRRLASGEEG